MPAVVSRTVAASGGDYTSLEAFNVGEVRDLVDADEIAQAVCEAFEDDNTQVTFGSGGDWTTDVDRYVHIVPAAGAEAQMPWEPTNAYRLVGPIATGANVLNVSVHMRVERIQIELRQYSFDFNHHGISVIGGGGTGGASLVMDGCVIRGVDHADNSGQFRGAIVSDASAFHIRNTYFLDFNGTSGADAWAFKNTTNGATRYLYNCTAINCTNGFEGSLSFAPVVAKNCMVDSRGISGAVNFTATYHADSANNASDLADAPGTDSRDNQTFTYEDAGAGDWRLTSADAGAREHGADLSADSVHPFSIDFFGTTRPQGSEWDIGAFEVEVSGGVIQGSGDGEFVAFVGFGSGVTSLSGTGVASFPTLTGTGDGSVFVLGSGSGLFPSFIGFGEGSLVDDIIQGTGDGALPPMTGVGSGLVRVTGDGISVFPSFTAAGDGSASVSGEGLGVFPALTGSGRESDEEVIVTEGAVWVRKKPRKTHDPREELCTRCAVNKAVGDRSLCPVCRRKVRGSL